MLLTALLLTGCLSRGGEENGGPVATPTSGEKRLGPEPAAARSETPAPQLAVGRAWTYEGSEFYNEDKRFTVVVASASGDGYLFAGGAEDDLVYEALWWSRWYNWHDRDLNRVDWDRPLLKFPLYDGATWSFAEGLTLTARAGKVETPLGEDAGYVIEGASERATVHVEYSPRAQNVVRYHVTLADGSVTQDLRMTSVEDARSWVWYELGPLAAAKNTHEPGVLDVAEGFDHVLVSAGGTTGGRARVDGPGGATWSADFTGAETWKHAMLPAAPGKWLGSVAGRPLLDDAPELPASAPIGWAYMHVAPVRWVYGP